MTTNWIRPDQYELWPLQSQFIVSIWIITKASVKFRKKCVLQLVSLFCVFKFKIKSFHIHAYLTDVHTKLRSPCNSTSLKTKSIFTALFPPCLICMRFIFSGSIRAKATLDSPIKYHRKYIKNFVRLQIRKKNLTAIELRQNYICWLLYTLCIAHTALWYFRRTWNERILILIHKYCY